MADARRNIELKARDLDPARSLAVCWSLGAEDRGEIWQCDTYFTVPTGRLKLREERPGDAHLIQYERADRPEQRESRYRIAPVADPETMLEVLRASLPVRVAVTKRRRLFIHGRVRIHLDDVEELRHFVELEAVAATESDLRAERRRITDHVAATFGGPITVQTRHAAGRSDRVASLGHGSAKIRLASVARTPRGDLSPVPDGAPTAPRRASARRPPEDGRQGGAPATG